MVTPYDWLSFQELSFRQRCHDTLVPLSAGATVFADFQAFSR
jgi:hypothetical protein